MLTLRSQYIYPLAFKRPVGAMRHPQSTPSRRLFVYRTILVLGLTMDLSMATENFGHAAGKVHAGEIVTMELDTLGYTSGVLGSLRWAMSAINGICVMQIVPSADIIFEEWWPTYQ